MRRAVRLEAEASADLVSAVEHYVREAGNDVALRFVERAEECFDLLARHPEGGRMFEGTRHVRLRSLRAWSMGDFPYVIFYEADARGICVYAVVHASRELSRVLSQRFTRGRA